MVNITTYEKTDEYEALIVDLKSILVEGVWASRWRLIETYHQIGTRILEDDNFQKHAKGNESSFLPHMAGIIGISERTLYRTIQFAEKYPIIEKLPEGKNISWTKIIRKYLPEPKDKIEESCRYCPIKGHCHK